jgi:hypothetical protein
MQALIDQMQGKIKSYKKQIEEAEEIAAINLAKYRKAQQDLEESEERSKLCEASLMKFRATRGPSMTPAPVSTKLIDFIFTKLQTLHLKFFLQFD